MTYLGIRINIFLELVHFVKNNLTGKGYLTISSDVNGSLSYKKFNKSNIVKVEQRKIPKNLFATNAIGIYVI